MLLELGELLGRDVAFDGQVAQARAHVLAEREHIDIMRAKGSEHIQNFGACLAEAEHQA